jgi:2-polyprenyl-3-methyl-5-hydroxy-6-metoxy-1,4-benzoquinol methylase
MGAIKKPCWCGERNLQPFSAEYLRCATCETLVSQVGLCAAEVTVADDEQAFYGKNYWLSHQQMDLGYPDIHQRARGDLPERCVHWLRSLLRYQPPPARVLEVGCAHGGYVALLRSLGYDAVGLEMSPWVTEYARRTFGIPVLCGPIEDQQLPEQTLDTIVLNDVVEHFPDPSTTLACCAGLLAPSGTLMVQMPCYPEGASFEQLRAAKHRFLDHVEGKARQHIYLFSRRAARTLFARLGFPHLDFVPAIFDCYDMALITSRRPLVQHDFEALAAILAKSPAGRMQLAWLDLVFQCEQREADRAARLEVIHRLDAALREALGKQAGAMSLSAMGHLPARVIRYCKRLAGRGSRAA